MLPRNATKMTRAYANVFTAFSPSVLSVGRGQEELVKFESVILVYHFRLLIAGVEVCPRTNENISVRDRSVELQYLSMGFILGAV